jgi:hypothetical protein
MGSDAQDLRYPGMTFHMDQQGRVEAIRVEQR